MWLTQCHDLEGCTEFSGDKTKRRVVTMLIRAILLCFVYLRIIFVDRLATTKVIEKHNM